MAFEFWKPNFWPNVWYQKLEGYPSLVVVLESCWSRVTNNVEVHKVNREFTMTSSGARCTRIAATLPRSNRQGCRPSRETGSAGHQERQDQLSFKSVFWEPFNNIIPISCWVTYWVYHVFLVQLWFALKCESRDMIWALLENRRQYVSCFRHQENTLIKQCHWCKWWQFAICQIATCYLWDHLYGMIRSLYHVLNTQNHFSSTQIEKNISKRLIEKF